MTIGEHPCKGGLTPECIRSYPQWARKMFSYRLLVTICPQRITKRLPKLRGLFPYVYPPEWNKDLPWLPGYSLDPETVFPPDWKPGDDLPAGVTLSPKTVFPPGWKPGDDLPAGVTFILEKMFTPGWKYEDGLPPGVTYAPNAMFPLVWTSGDDLPAGQINGIGQRPAVLESGAISPLFLEIGVPAKRDYTSVPAQGEWEPWGSTICENHAWMVENVYFPVGGSSYYFYDIYDCELGPDLTLDGDKLIHSFTNPATNNNGRNEHEVECSIYLEYPETAGLVGITKVEINFPVVEMSGTPPYTYLRPIIYVFVGFVKGGGESASKSLILYDRLNPDLGPGVHQELLDSGEEVRVISVCIKTRTYKNNTATWSCDYITFT